MIYCNLLTIWNKIKCNVDQNTKKMKRIWKYRLLNAVHFCSGAPYLRSPFLHKTKNSSMRVLLIIVENCFRKWFGAELVASHHYSDVTMSAMASRIASISSVCLTVRPRAQQRKYRSSSPLAFLRGIHRCPVVSPENVPIWWHHHLMTNQVGADFL